MNNNGNNSKSTASLVCGIVSLFIIPRIFGIAAVILGIMGYSAEDKKTSAVIGIVLGIFSFLYSFSTTNTVYWF